MRLLESADPEILAEIEAMAPEYTPTGWFAWDAADRKKHSEHLIALDRREKGL